MSSLQTVFPSLEQEAVPLSKVREGNASLIRDILRAQGKKLILLHPSVYRPLFAWTLNPSVWGRLLRGVQFQALGRPIDASSVTEDVCVVLLLRPTSKDCTDGAAAVKALFAAGHRRIVVHFISYRGLAVDLFFEREAGPAVASLKISALDLATIPVENDLALLPIFDCFAEAFCSPYPANVIPIARALAMQSSLCGWPRTVVGKGSVAGLVAKQLRSFYAATSPVTLSGADDVMIILDRTSDPVSALSPQGTYDGVLDELLGLDERSILVPETVASTAEYRPKAVPVEGPTLEGYGVAPTEISVGTPVHKAIRDASWYAVRTKLAEVRSEVAGTFQALTEAVQSVRQNKGGGSGAAPLRDVTRRMKDAYLKEADVKVHGELHAWASSQVDRRDKITRLYQSLLAVDSSADAAVAECVKMLLEGAPLVDVLNLLCVVSHTVAVSPAQIELLQTELVNEHGPAALAALSVLIRSGLFRDATTAPPADAAASPEAKREEDLTGGLKRLFGRAVETVKRAIAPRYARLAESLKLFDGLCCPFSPQDINFVMWGYAPISARFVEQVVTKGPQRAAVVAEHMVGDCSIIPLDPSPPVRPNARRTITVVVIGGITRSEIAALRWLADSAAFRSPAGEQARVCIISTSIITSKRLLKEALKGVSGLRI